MYFLSCFFVRTKKSSKFAVLFSLPQVLSFTHPTAFHSAETYESLLQCLKMEDDKVAEAAIQIFRNTGQKIETELPQIRSYEHLPNAHTQLFGANNNILNSLYTY